MRLLPEGISDLDPNLRWIVGESLRLIEEVVCGLQTSGAGAPGMEEGVGLESQYDTALFWRAFPQYLPRYGT